MAWKVELSMRAQRISTGWTRRLPGVSLLFSMTVSPRWMIRAASEKPSRVPGWENSGNIAWAITGSSPRSRTPQYAFSLLGSATERKCTAEFRRKRRRAKPMALVLTSRGMTMKYIVSSRAAEHDSLASFTMPGTNGPGSGVDPNLVRKWQ